MGGESLVRGSLLIQACRVAGMLSAPVSPLCSGGWDQGLSEDLGLFCDKGHPERDASLGDEVGKGAGS